MQEFEEENSFHPEKDSFYSHNDLEKNFFKDENVNSILQINSENKFNKFNSDSFNFIGLSEDKDEIYLLLNEMNKAINVNIDIESESQMVVKELLSIMKKPISRIFRHNKYNDLKFKRKIISLEGKILTNTLTNINNSNSNNNIDSTIKDTTSSTRCNEQIPNETFNKKSS